MVLVHKLKQMEELDIAQFREGVDEEMDDTHLASELDDPSDTDNKSFSSLLKKKTASPPRRPLTRSQTTPSSGRASTRKSRSGESETENPKPGPKAKIQPKSKPKDKEPKRQKTQAAPASRKRPIAEVESEDDHDDSVHDDTRRPSKRNTSETSISFSIGLSRSNTTTPPPPNVGQFPSQDQSTPADSATDSDRRGPRSRATLPVPVPNLTKKSRGRRVPTKGAATEKDGMQKETRVYVCKVEGCGKCFHRGEHLKRHIRSIHTHEKPFKCSHPACDKFFNRHDNLLQHLKVHKDLLSLSSANSPSNPPLEGPGPLPAVQQQDKQQRRSPSPEVDPESSPQSSPRRLPAYPPAPSSSSSYPSYELTRITPGLATNVAVSSLRTDMSVSSLRTDMSVSSLRTSISEPVSSLRTTNMAVSSVRTEMPHSPPRSLSHEAPAKLRMPFEEDEGARPKPSPLMLLKPTSSHDWQG